MAPVGTKADDLALALEEAIVSGEIAPGTVLRQEQLSEQYQVCRTPVREALRRLAALGLVSFVPNRGVRVRTLSREELREAFLVRAELESLATELATPQITADGLAALDEAEQRFSELTLELRRRAREGTQDGALRRELGAREPRLPRRDLRGRRRPVRRAAGEERAAQLLHARRLGGRPRHRPPVRAERPAAPRDPRGDRRRAAPRGARCSRASTCSRPAGCWRRSSTRCRSGCGGAPLGLGRDCPRTGTVPIETVAARSAGVRPLRGQTLRRRHIYR